MVRPHRYKKGDASLPRKSNVDFFRFHTMVDSARRYMRTNARRGEVDLLRARIPLQSVQYPLPCLHSSSQELVFLTCPPCTDVVLRSWLSWRWCVPRWSLPLSANISRKQFSLRGSYSSATSCLLICDHSDTNPRCQFFMSIHAPRKETLTSSGTSHESLSYIHGQSPPA
ncbi:hypothetical protein PISMIDRAFT_412820 [Pisolithus microcarpus 441]|uniref:Uncharacterized protein n=1 Tax=Pisolithus microcarpus 441 TaxID=765257 RepID=A0A0C9ZEL3_9AGAM|nr:hypothetical protein PISMIDRAFT_412820 [Pisolithus microcarpus 441]